jgi:hypothetical protein
MLERFAEVAFKEAKSLAFQFTQRPSTATHIPNTHLPQCDDDPFSLQLWLLELLEERPATKSRNKQLNRKLR